jgi:alpha-beta hydrolase superfamily lysophospholipase
MMDANTGNRGTAFLRRSLTGALMLVMLSTTVTAATAPADAFWPFSKKQGKDAKRKKRELQGKQVGLVPGNPPALYWSASKPRAVVLCLHELGLYNGVFDDMGKRLADKNVAVYAIDLRGFGGWREMDKKESKMDLVKTLADVKGSCEEIRKLHPDIPVFILGEAMGGALALEAASKYPTLINGIISAAPGGEHHKSVNNFVNVGVGMAVGSKHAFGLGEKLMDVATPKQALKEALSEDEMVRMDVTSNEMIACQFFMYKTRTMAKSIKDMPVLIVHGEKDGESKVIGSQAVYKNLATKNKKFVRLAEGDHYTFEDIKVSDDAFSTALAFIDENSGGRTVSE